MSVRRTVGSDYRLRDAVERVVGTVPFVLDVTVPGMLHGKAVRATLPHARLRGVDVDRARRAPGVVGVVSGQDLADDPGIVPYFGGKRADQPVLALGKVRYVGEPVAVVVAETAGQAAAAAELVEVDYEELDFVVDPVEAMQPDAPLVHDEWERNDCGDWRLSRGDPERGFREADRVYEGTYTTPTGSHVPMEPHVCVAQWNGDELEVWSSAQAPHHVKRTLESMFGLEDGQVRVRTRNLGGAYGAKGQTKIEPMVACVARLVGRPVRMAMARDEVFFTIGRHGAHVTIRTGVTHDGVITAREVEAVYNAGAYAVTSPGASGQGLIRAPGPYRIPNIAIHSTARYTNTVPTGPFRGAMTAQVCLAYECQLDEIAADLGLDAVELRRRNVLRDGDEYATGEEMHDMHYEELLEDLAEGIRWQEKPVETPPGRARGKGLGIMIKSTVTPSRSEVRLELHPDGKARLYSSSVEMGQGASATLVQLASDALGVEPGRIELPFPDTAVTPFDTTTSSSRTTFSMGAAIDDAARNLENELRRLAAKTWECDEARVRVAQGTVRHEDGTEAPYEEIVRGAGLSVLSVEGVFQSSGGLFEMDPHDVHGRATVHWHQGGAAAEVEVDLETGVIQVLRCHGAAYAGRVVSPLRAMQQIQGCIVYGLGPALFEQVLYESGQMSNPNLSDYMIPSILDVPTTVTSSALESDDPTAELHGIGEMALPGLAPAIANAVANATGARLRQVPFTPERVLRALDEIRDRETQA